MQSLSFNRCDSKPAKMRSYGSAKMLFEGSLSFNGKDLNTKFSICSPTSDIDKMVFARSISLENGDKGERLIISDGFSMKTPNDKLMRFNSLHEKTPRTSLAGSGNERHQAAVKLQKVYKSFRTRRQLADCAVVVEQRWWKLLDFAELKRSSISFFDIEKPESALHRWSRARTRAAKLGKGLSKDEKARKLALQHWLEAIDPRHRYGHNLQFYYVNWLHCQSKQPFFYWLDIGEGKEVNLERCPRSKLQQQCIKYLGPTERQTYEVVVEDGKLSYKQSRKLLDTTEGPKDAKWIFVLSTSKTLYVGKKNKGTFQHSSFLAGGATLSAGRLVVEDGILKAVWPHSGHYLPTEENFQEFVSFLREHKVDVSKVQKSPVEGEEAFTLTDDGSGIRNNMSDADLTSCTDETNDENLDQENTDSGQNDSNAAETNDENLDQENTDSGQNDSNAAESADPQTSKLSLRLGSNITRLEIPSKYNLLYSLKQEDVGPSCQPQPPSSPLEDGYISAEDSLFTEEDFMFPKYNLFDNDDEGDEEPIPKEAILRRIDSHKGMKSYQLAKQLSSKWTTGAGPRIGCMRDYPSGLQFRVLEQAQLSPRSTNANSSPQNASRFTPRVSSPTSTRRETMSNRSPLSSAQV